MKYKNKQRSVRIRTTYKCVTKMIILGTNKLLNPFIFPIFMQVCANFTDNKCKGLLQDLSLYIFL